MRYSGPRVVIPAVLAVACALASTGLAAGRPAGRVVAVPKVTQTYDLVDAYTRLNRAGLQMAIPQAFSLRSLCLPTAGTQTPASGTRVHSPSTVTVGDLTCLLGSPAGGHDRAAVVPDFAGRPASSAVDWAERNQLYWELDRLPALRPSSRARLLDNYVVTAQRPAAGSLLARGTACRGVAGGCFEATPLIMRARVRR